MNENLFAQFVNKLVKAQIDFSLEFIVEKLLMEHVECIVRTVIVQIQWIQHVPRDGQNNNGLWMLFQLIKANV